MIKEIEIRSDTHVERNKTIKMCALPITLEDVEVVLRDHKAFMGPYYHVLMSWLFVQLKQLQPTEPLMVEPK